jgi:hypothetical protein
VKISDVWGVFICEVKMPYLNADDPKLPDNVKELDKDKREQWVSIFNDVYERAIADDKTKDEAEQAAFTQANGVVLKKEPESKQLEMPFHADVVEPPNLHRSLGHTKCVLCVYFRKIVPPSRGEMAAIENEVSDIKTYCKLYKTDVMPYQVCDDYINTQAFLTSKAYDAKIGMRNSARDMEILQGLHDGTCKLGATCKSRHLEEMVMKRAIPLARAPIAPRETKWDSGAAHNRAVEWATTDDSLNLDKYARLHLYVMGDGENITDYKLQYQDIVDGKPTIIPQSVITIANNPQRGLEAVKEIPEEDKTKIKANLSRLFTRMRNELEDFDLKPRWEQTEGKANIQPVPKEHNALQPIGFDEEGNFIAKNYIVLFDKKDLEGTVNSRENPDGSKGEYFTKETDFESSYTKTNNVLLDWEHRQGGKNEPGPHDPLGRVNWKTVEKDDEGLFAEIVLEKRARYFNMLVELIENGLLATSTEPVQGQVVKSTDGKIEKWPMFRDTLTPTPMELSMYDPRQLELYRKAAKVIPAFAKSLSNVERDKHKIKIKALKHINKNNLLLLQGV